MKNLNDFTLKEFEEYSELIQEKDVDVFRIMELFDIDEPNNLPFDKYNKYWVEIQGMTLDTSKKVKIEYKIGNMKFKPVLDILSLNAAQFIDFQNYMNEFKLHQVLSVFMLPKYKKGFIWKTRKYADGYNPLDIQDYLYNNMKIGEANILSGFFLKSSVILLETIKDCSENKMWMMKKKQIKIKQKINFNG